MGTVNQIDVIAMAQPTTRAPSSGLTEQSAVPATALGSGDRGMRLQELSRSATGRGHKTDTSETTFATSRDASPPVGTG